MSIKQLIGLAIYVISETATQDTKVGGSIKAVKISIDGGYKEFDSSEIKKIIEKNEKVNKILKQYFYGEGENEEK